MLRLGFLLFLALHLGCDGNPASEEGEISEANPETALNTETASNPEAASDPEASSNEEGSSNEEEASNVQPESPVGACGMGSTVEVQRSGCEDDAQCMLGRTDYRSCSDNRCGPPAFAYNCEFATRLAEFCEGNVACDDGTRDLGALAMQCGGGASSPMEAFCDEGICRSRPRPTTLHSRLVSVSGPLSEREVERLIRRARGRIESCLAGEVERTADVNVALTFEINAPATGGIGGIGAVALIHGDADSNRVACAMNEIRSLEFPLHGRRHPGALPVCPSPSPLRMPRCDSCPDKLI
ncbi:MAG: hypothetical protein ACI9KE_005065 [Polyangiales bacterium]|jgi:hypothetical protein